MRGNLGDFARLHHILEAIIEIEQYTKSVSMDAFMENSMIRFASIKQLEIIGEATNHLTESTKQKFREIEWKQIVGMRHVFVHEYFGIDNALLWDIIQNDLPDLKAKILKLIEFIK